MIEKKIEWFSVKEAMPSNGGIVLVYKPAGKKDISDLFDFAIFHEDWDGEPAFIDMVVRNGNEVRLSYKPEFWTEIPFPS